MGLWVNILFKSIYTRKIGRCGEVIPLLGDHRTRKCLENVLESGRDFALQYELRSRTFEPFRILPAIPTI